MQSKAGKATGSNGTQRKATRSDGTQREATEAKGSNAKQRKYIGRDGEHIGKQRMQQEAQREVQREAQREAMASNRQQQEAVEYLTT